MVSNYYPFGLAQTGRNWDGSNGNYRYGYNGKEEDNEIKTNSGDNGKSLDYGARWYDPRKARWDAVDPYEAKYPSLSPYNGIGNSPIILIDSDGREVHLYNKANELVGIIKPGGDLIIKPGMEAEPIVVGYLTASKYFESSPSAVDVFVQIENSTRVLSIKEVSVGEETESISIFSLPKNTVYGNDLNESGDWQPEEITEVVRENNNSMGGLRWNILTGGIDDKGNKHSPALIFIHELIHALRSDENITKSVKNIATKGIRLPLEEEQVIELTNKISVELNNGDGGNGSRGFFPSKGAFLTDKVNSLDVFQGPLIAPVQNNKKSNP